MSDEIIVDGNSEQSAEIAALTVLVAVLVKRLGGDVAILHAEADSVMNSALEFKQTPFATEVKVVEP